MSVSHVARVGAPRPQAVAGRSCGVRHAEARCGSLSGGGAFRPSVTTRVGESSARRSRGMRRSGSPVVSRSGETLSRSSTSALRLSTLRKTRQRSWHVSRNSSMNANRLFTITSNHAVERTTTRHRVHVSTGLGAFTPSRARSRWPSLTLFSLDDALAAQKADNHVRPYLTKVPAPTPSSLGSLSRSAVCFIHLCRPLRRRRSASGCIYPLPRPVVTTIRPDHAFTSVGGCLRAGHPHRRPMDHQRLRHRSLG